MMQYVVEWMITHADMRLTDEQKDLPQEKKPDEKQTKPVAVAA